MIAHRLHSFDPIASENPRVLILGTMPGRDSLKYHQYYGYRRNHFWPMIYGITGSMRDPWRECYEERLALLQASGIALWDVYSSCFRDKGSLDLSIHTEQFNPVAELLVKFPTIEALFFNGSRAEKGFSDYIQLLQRKGQIALVEASVRREKIRLPSSSPIPTKYVRSLEDKLPQWNKIAEFLSITR